jgi:hypothetical protein
MLAMRLAILTTVVFRGRVQSGALVTKSHSVLSPLRPVSASDALIIET